MEFPQIWSHWSPRWPGLGEGGDDESCDDGTNGLASGLNPDPCWIMGNGGGEKGTPLTDGVAMTVAPLGIGYAIIVGWPWQVNWPGTTV